MAKTTIHSDYIPDNAITSTKIAENSIGAREIATNAITTLYVADGSVSSEKLASNIDIAGTFDVTGATTLDSTLSVSGNITGTLATAAQPNITSLGTLTGLTGGTGDLNWDSGTLFVDSSANSVGIGIASNINANLHVGSSNATGDATNPAIQIGGSSSGNTFRLGFYTSAEGGVIENKNGDDGIQFRVKTAGEAMRIDSSGNVGIGTSSPNQSSAGSQHSVLTLKGSGTLGNGIFELIQKGTSGNNQTLGDIRFLDDTNQNVSIEALRETSTDSGYLIFKTRPAAGSLTERMRIDASGNVGIGTDSPTTFGGYKTLHFKNTGGDAIQLTETDGGVINQILCTDSSGGKILLGSRSNHPTIFCQNDTERMRIDSSGAVGIGQVPETARYSGHDILQVGGRATLLGNDTVSATGQTALLDNLYYDASGNFQHRGDSRGVAMQFVEGQVIFSNSNQTTGTPTVTSRMTLDNDGNVGIGTDNPASLLHLKSTANSVGPTLIFENTNNAQSMNIDYYNNAGAVQSRIGYDEGPTAFSFIPNVSSTAAMYIAYDGNVGIGTTDPQNTLHIHANAVDSRMQFTNNSSGTTYADGLWVGLDNTQAYLLHRESTPLTFWTSATKRMTIDSNGRVSIGTTAANAGLTVANGDIRTTAPAFANDANSFSMSQESTGGTLCARGPNGSTRGTIQLSVNEDDGGGGRVGLKIENDASVTMAYMPSGSASSDVNINLSTNKLFYVSSSQRYKTNITDLSTSTTDILSLRPVNYDRVSEELTGEVGLIAEEVYEIIPHLVNLADVDGFDTPQPESVKYSQLSVYLLKAIQEQQTIIDDLKSRIETLEG